jgi:hypothetical protein
MKVVWEESFQIQGQVSSVYSERYLGARSCTSLKLALNTRHPVHSISSTTPSDIPCYVPWSTQLTASGLQTLRELNSQTHEIMSWISNDHYIETRSKEIRKWPSLNRKRTCFPGVTVVIRTDTLISAQSDVSPSCIPRHVYNSQHPSDEQGKILLFPLSIA